MLEQFAADVWPEGIDAGRFVARVYDPAVGGPAVVVVRRDRTIDVSRTAPTMSDLLERAELLDMVDAAAGNGWWTADLIANSLAQRWDEPHFIAPNDLQVIKACGVTFVRSMVERVIEEKVAGDPQRAAAVRASLQEAVGGSISAVEAGSEEAVRVKDVLVRDGLWSQYLEVGIGPDPEVFTKAPVMSALGLGAEIGVLSTSTWNNPEPELVLAVSSTGRILGATLGNDVNLRDVEGRSALLLGKAKDNNASCSVGPFIRLFDETFGLDDASALTITTRITGLDDFSSRHTGSVAEISRPIEVLVQHVIGRHHQYPDGFMLFTGTPFAPTDDRHGEGQGFTHDVGDVVAISTPLLGTLVNSVTTSEQAAPWVTGVRALYANLVGRGLLVGNGGR